ncbi:MAG: hypothetical protein ACE5GL_06865 [Calditrichia bacterium]
MKQVIKPKTGGGIVFLNSFESVEDTKSWYWAGDYHLINDTPPGGGQHAVRVEGRNIFPAATFISHPLKYGGYFTIQCWGKVIDKAGYVELSTISDHEVEDAIQVYIFDPEWKFGQSSDTLYCPPEKSLMLSMHAGLQMAGAMAVDLIQVKKVGRADKSLTTGNRKIVHR